MRAISLWQPWASAIALGHKRIETRGRSTSVRGPILIHAARKFGPEQRNFAMTEVAVGRMPRALPLGALVAVARLQDVKPTCELKTQVSAIERLYGDYAAGRFGWLLTDIVPLPEPIPFAGSQGWFNVPDELVAHVLPGAADVPDTQGRLL